MKQRRRSQEKAREKAIEREVLFGIFPVLPEERRYGFLDAVLILSGYCIATWSYTQGAYLASLVGFRQLLIGAFAGALFMLLRSFSYDSPRAETCCDLGKHFMDKGQLQIAIFWYETAASRPRNDQSGGFVLTDCYDYIPYLQLCVCYDRLGEHKTAFRYNEKAAKIKPQSEAVKLNRDYFSKLLPGAD